MNSTVLPHESIPDTLISLAPTELPLYRTERYDGGGFSVTLYQFAPEDVSLIIRLYTAVKKTYDLWLYMREDPNYNLLARHLTAEFGSDQFISSMQAIGAATYALKEPKPLLRKVIHDVRGGALTVVVGYARLINMVDSQAELIEDLSNAILNVRDHAKLMRNAIEDIDPIVREADEGLKLHFIDDFVNKWHGANFSIADKAVKIKVRCTFEGSITNRCLETSAIDRILYNYINNAARFTADDMVSLTIFPVGDSLVRWVVKNSITVQQKEWLDANAGPNLKRLFTGGLTRGGHGIGLSNCADFVASSFGVTPEDAVERGYLGAKLIDTQYYAWFHWPAYHPAADDPVCDCGD